MQQEHEVENAPPPPFPQTRSQGLGRYGTIKENSRNFVNRYLLQVWVDDFEFLALKRDDPDPVTPSDKYRARPFR
jgi:hypothetical protein